MGKRYASKRAPRFLIRQSTARALLVLFFLCLLIRLVSPGLQSWVDELSQKLSSTGAAEMLLRTDLGDIPESSTSHALNALKFSTGLRYDMPQDTIPREDDPVKIPASKPGKSRENDDPSQTESQSDAQIPPDTPDAVETTITGEGGGYQAASEGIFLKNKTEYDINVDELLASPLSLDTGGRVLIIHTHGSEAYTPDGDDIYKPTDPSRTEDTNYNVVRVGDELEKILTDRGVSVIHDRALYDYPTYTGSYNRSYDAICAYQEQYPDISVVIDLHRDALESADGTVYKTVADIGGVPCAQVMLIVGTSFSGLEHPQWRENLKFALRLQTEMVTEYPSLARPLSISEYRYNQHATTGSLIAEIGCNGNTLQEALCAVRYFGECLAAVLGK